jgi:hypothetical protein
LFLSISKTEDPAAMLFSALAVNVNIYNQYDHGPVLHSLHMQSEFTVFFTYTAFI